MAGLLPLKAGRNIWGDCDLNDVKFVENLSAEKTAVRGGQKSLLYPTFFIHFIREIVFYQGKVREFQNVISVANMKML